MSGPRGSWTSGLLSFALVLLFAGYAVNTAAHLIVAVLPLLVGFVVVGAAASVGLAIWRNRHYW